MTRYILEHGLAKQEFIDKWVNGAADYIKSLEPFTMEMASERCGLPIETLTVDVARQQAKHIHRRQMPDRIGPVRMQHQLRLRRGAGGEIEQHRVVRIGLPIGDEPGRRHQQIVIAVPALHRIADGDARQRWVHAVELNGLIAGRHDVPRPPPIETVLQIRTGQ